MAPWYQTQGWTLPSSAPSSSGVSLCLLSATRPSVSRTFLLLRDALSVKRGTEDTTVRLLASRRPLRNEGKFPRSLSSPCINHNSIPYPRFQTHTQMCHQQMNSHCTIQIFNFPTHSPSRRHLSMSMALLIDVTASHIAVKPVPNTAW